MKRLAKFAIVTAAGLSLFFGGEVVLAAKDGGTPSSPVFQNQKNSLPVSPPLNPQTIQRVQPPAPAKPKNTASPATAQDIRDIRGPISIPYPWLWTLYAGGGALLLLILLAVWRWIRKTKPFRAKSAHEIAFEQLQRARALIQPEEAELFSVAVSGAIRTYIEKRFQLTATHYTTEEFMERLVFDRPAILSSHSEVLEDFLRHCDLAKFARYNLSVDQMKAMHQSAWQFVENTIPSPVDETSGQKSEINHTVSGLKKTPTRGSLFQRLWAKSHSFFSKKPPFPASSNDDRAMAAGGGS